MSALMPSAWQRKAIDGIVRRLIGRNSPRAALLQLPTRFGKSLVAVRVYGMLRRIHPRLRLIVVLPKQEIPAGWRHALGFDENDKIPFFHHLPIKTTPGIVSFQTRKELHRALIDPARGWPPQLAREITATPHLVVVDEIHRYRKFLGTFFDVFRDNSKLGPAVAERRLSSPFRSPGRGKRVWPKWLLLSATPINPVSLDRIDPLDRKKGDDTFDPDREELRDEKILATALETTHGALAQLSGLQTGEWFNEHVRTVREHLSQVHIAEPAKIPRQLVIWPPQVRTPDLQPRSTPRWQCEEMKELQAQVDNAISQVVLTAQAIQAIKDVRGDHGHSRAMAERLVLSGGLLTTKGRLIQGQPYSLRLARSVKIAVAKNRDYGVVRPEKLDTLVKFIERIKDEHVLVFCIHRAVAVSVSQTIEKYVGGASVRTAIGNIGECANWFNELKSGEKRVLIATDACSESIDLHERANILVHYELPWSPLRVLQRVGRLWRLRRREIGQGMRPKQPRLPGVVHFAHPGSVDEEIISRLRRRWAYLRILGLDYLSYEQAMGSRLPAVPWPS